MSKKLTTEEFIRRATEVHGDKYIYDNVIYRGIHVKVEIICPIHGIFYQEPNKHINQQQGCPKCNGGVQSSKEDFVNKAYRIHGNKYSYENFIYVNKYTKGEIHCKACSKNFSQTPDNHINSRNGCPFCRQSRMEKYVERYLLGNKISFIYQANKNTLEWLKTKRGSFSLDFFFPQFNMAIECQGEQHFNIRENGIFTENVVIKTKERDKEKLRRCVEHGIIIEYINYNEDVIHKLNNILRKYTDELDSDDSKRY